MSADKPHIKNIVQNRRARFEYALLDTFEAGLSLLGSEVKSLRAGNANLQDSFVRLDRKGAVLDGAWIAPYPWATHEQHEPRRPRRLLLNKSELAKLRKGLAEKGMTIVPLRMYFMGSRVKLEIALGKGKKLHDKRQSIKERDVKRQLKRIR